MNNEPRRWHRAFTLLASPLLIAYACMGCTSSSLNIYSISQAAKVRITVIALAPSDGYLADMIGSRLSDRGFKVLSLKDEPLPQLRPGMSETEILNSLNLKSLRESGVEGVMFVRASYAHDRNPQTIIARVNSTSTGEVLAGVSWENGSGGISNQSPAYRLMRKSEAEAATEIAGPLAMQLH